MKTIRRHVAQRGRSAPGRKAGRRREELLAQNAHFERVSDQLPKGTGGWSVVDDRPSPWVDREVVLVKLDAPVEVNVALKFSRGFREVAVPAGASRAEGVGAAGASAAPTPDSNTFFECPSCGWATGIAGASLDPDEDRELLEQWEEDVQAHATECAERLHPLEQRTVSIPIAVYKKRHPHTGVPGLIVRCPQCKTSNWFERTKHGRKMLAEAIADHMDHTRVSR